MGEIKNYTSFFENIFGAEISRPVEISKKNPQMKVSKIAKNRYLRPENTIFRRFHILYVQYLGKGSK